MVKAFSLASWNVKHFSNDPTRIARVVAFLRQQNPDVFGLYEVTGGEVFNEMTSQFPGYSFEITEGRQTQEILVGVRNNLSVFFTQKLEFRSGTTHMRPGLLATLTIDDINYPVLFLHLASSTAPRGMGLRDDMLYKAVKFRHVLDDFLGGHHLANYLFVGDLNTMGMYYPYDRGIDAETELRKWDARAGQYYGMRRLRKHHEVTWSGGSASEYADSNLDHVYASENLNFLSFQDAQGANVDVDVRGWVDHSPGNARDNWITRYSDHSLLYLEVQKV